MRALLPYLITGLATGSLYGLAGVGLVLTFRTSGVFNFGHGAIGAGAAFLFYTLHTTDGLPWPLAVLITLAVFATVVGWLLERITRGLQNVPQAVTVVTTVGILLGIQGALFVIYGVQARPFAEFLPKSGFTLSGVNVSWAQVVNVVMAAAMSLGLYAFLRQSRLGVGMRAVVDNSTLVGLTGQRAVRIRRASWMIGSAFAALSGILLAPTLGLDATLLTLLVVQAFGACAIGRFSSLPLTYGGGLLIGVAASLATKYLTKEPFNGIPTSVPFLVLVLVLLIVPVSKLPGFRTSVRGLAGDRPTRLTPSRLLVGGAGLVALLFVPSLVGTKLPVWISALISVVIFGSLALLVWTSGQISLGHAAFAALGATNMAHLHALPWPVALVLAGVLTVPVGALVAIPAIRLSGIYLALMTLGFGILMQNMLYGTSIMFGSKLFATRSRPRFGVVDATSDRGLYYVVLAVAVITCVTLVLISRGRLGRVLRAMSESPTMLSTHGLSVMMTRLTVFGISAFFAGVGGALMVTQSGSVSGVSFGPIQSLILLAVLAICGTRLLRSSILAAGLFAIVPGYVSGFGVDRQALGFGVVAIVAALVAARRSDIAGWLREAVRVNERRSEHSPVRSRHLMEVPS